MCSLAYLELLGSLGSAIADFDIGDYSFLFHFFLAILCLAVTTDTLLEIL